MKTLNWTCMFHGKKLSEHECIVCDICFRHDIGREDLAINNEDEIISVCKECYGKEQTKTRPT